jgi:antirestriction protein ArdC
LIEAHQPGDLLEQLAAKVSELTGTAQWRRHLEFQSRFHRYSYGNVLLIAAQFPSATQVAGFHTWRKLHRSVRRGERAIWILAPVLHRDAQAAEARPEIGEAVSGRHVVGFRSAAVFDLSQTEGEEPLPVCGRLRGEGPAGVYAGLLRVAAAIGFSVEDHEFEGATNGDCSPVERRIRVEVRNAGAQRVKTLAHELAHALLHQGSDDRSLAELEAESTAYVVCHSLGIDSSEYSLGYLASWAGGGPQAVAGIRASCERIQRTAAAILAGVHEAERLAGQPPLIAGLRE